MAPCLTWATVFSPTSARTSVRSNTSATGFESRALTILAAGRPRICGSMGPRTENSPMTALQLFSEVGELASTDETSDVGGVAYMAHIGGFLAGFWLTFLFRGVSASQA